MCGEAHPAKPALSAAAAVWLIETEEGQALVTRAVPSVGIVDKFKHLIVEVRRLAADPCKIFQVAHRLSALLPNGFYKLELFTQLFGVSLFAILSPIVAGQNIAPATVMNLPNLNADEIVHKLVENNRKRAKDLGSYTAKRTYTLSYRGLGGNREAAMDVIAHYTRPATKSFEVTSERGSKLLLNRVLKKLLESEKEASQPGNQERTALSSDNYHFQLIGVEPSEHGGCYRLQVQPQRDDKFLYRGTVCVNGVDFAVESIDAAPAKSPSFWIRETRIAHRYTKLEGFWLPASNESVTKVKLGGLATLTIRYYDYDLHSDGVAK